MATIDQLAVAVLNGDQLRARGLALEITRAGDISSISEPDGNIDRRILILAAGLAELLAGYADSQAPAWTARWGALAERLDLLPATSERLRRLLGEEAPESLKRRNILAPAGFLRAV